MKSPDPQLCVSWQMSMCTNRLWLERCYWERKDGDARETCPPPETVCLLSHESALVCSELYETNLSVSGTRHSTIPGSLTRTRLTQHHFFFPREENFMVLLCLHPGYWKQNRLKVAQKFTFYESPEIQPHLDFYRKFQATYSAETVKVIWIWDIGYSSRN